MLTTNAFLRREYLQEFNRRLALPAGAESGFVSFEGDVDRYFCIQEERVVGNDNTVRFASLVLQIVPQKFRFSLAKSRVLVRRQLDETITLWYGAHLLGRYTAEGALMEAPERRETRAQAAA